MIKSPADTRYCSVPFYCVATVSWNVEQLSGDYVNCITCTQIIESLSTMRQSLLSYLLGFFNKYYYDSTSMCVDVCCLKPNLLSRSQDEALRTGVPCRLLEEAVGPGYSGRAGQGLDSLSRSSLGSGMLPMPVEALPTEWFLRWLNSDMLEEREWPVL